MRSNYTTRIRGLKYNPRAMDSTDVQQLLREGITAIKNGDRLQGRELLLKVVAANDRLEPAWLWLSSVMDEPQDQLVALENALTLNPHNAAAVERARKLREQLGLAPHLPPPPPKAPEPEPEPEATLPEPLPEEVTYQCVYCGQPTREADTRCRHCGRSLLVMGKWQGKGFQYVILIISGLFAQSAALQMFGAVISLSLSHGFDPLIPNILSKLPLVPMVLGEFVMRSQGEALNVVLASIVRLVVTLVILLMFYTDMNSAYGLAIWVLLADMGWGWLAVNQLQWMALGTAQLNAGFAIVMMVICLLAVLNQLGARQREFVEVDRTLTNALALYVRGRELARRGKWAAAAVHWDKAAALKPSEATYAKDLASALVRLGRYEHALEALQRGHEFNPGDTDFKPLMETVKRKEKL